jgi:DNA-binding CsgD family transcriptional regulator
MTARDILHQLIGQVQSPSSVSVLSTTQETINEVLLESELDGTRYYLVRSRPQLEETVRLSPRERDIARLVALGLPNKCIAKQLQISPWTVATHLRRIFAKLDVNSRSAAIAKLARHNLL